MKKRVENELLDQHTISVLGGKGSGKTTFLVLEGIRRAYEKKSLLIDCGGIITLKKLKSLGVANKVRLLAVTQKLVLQLEDRKNLKEFFKFLFRDRRVLFVLRLELTATQSGQFFNLICPDLSQLKNIVLLIDESQEVLPQLGRGYSPELEKLVRLGRNFNITIYLGSQRPQSLDKKVLGLVDMHYFGKMTYYRDINILSEILGLGGAKIKSEFQRSIKRLNTGVFFEIFQENVSTVKYDIQKRELETIMNRPSAWVYQVENKEIKA